MYDKLEFKLLKEPETAHAVPVKKVTPEPSDYPSLSTYLEACGKIEFTSFQQLTLAKNLFVIKRQSAGTIAKQLRLKTSTIKHWIVTWDWEEERDKKLFSDFRKLNQFRVKSKDLEKKSDTLAARIEDIAQEILDAHDDSEEKLTVKDLKTLADIVSSSYSMRKLISRGGKDATQEIKHDHTITVDAELLRSVGATLKDVVPKQLERREEIQMELGNIQDAEFEMKKRTTR